MKHTIRVFVSLLIACIGQLSAQTSLNFDLRGPSGVETIQNSFIFADDGVTATTTAWSYSRTAPNPEFQASKVVQWSPGIGVKNSTETITNVPYVPYYVDNEDHYDFVLFVFSENVDIKSVSLTPSSGTFDLDATFWLGNMDPNVALSGDSFANLSTLGFGNRNHSDGIVSNSGRSVGITTPSGGVNALLFGSRVGGDADTDRFKIVSIQGMTAVPEPGTAGLLVASMALALRRRRH